MLDVCVNFEMRGSGLKFSQNPSPPPKKPDILELDMQIILKTQKPPVFHGQKVAAIFFVKNLVRFPCKNELPN